jgi:hypothetical protein
MATFKSLSESEKNESWKKIFNVLASRESDEITKDSATEITLDAGELQTIRDTLYEEVKSNLGEVQSLDEMKQSLVIDTKKLVNTSLTKAKEELMLMKNQGIVQDGYYNPISGIGTSIDPGIHTKSFIPVSMSPSEATSYYASGGIPAKVINKKSGCLNLDGIKFEGKDWSPEELTQLADYAQECGFAEAKAQADVNALIYGGAIVYPKFENDNPILTQKNINEILAAQTKEKDFIKYWVNVDRWNCVFVPETNITLQDYMYARSVFIPLGGERVNTQRCAMVRPNKQPFWSAIAQMGWSTSDFEGWVKDFESYAIMKASLPIMAQQMSLMYHSFPADGLIIENGPKYAEQFFKKNEAEMRDWSMLNPKAINSVGEIKILDRTYSGFKDLIQESKIAFAAGCGIPESVLFAEKPSGLASDNSNDVELKQSETIRLLFNNIAPSYKNCIELLVYSCFGRNSDQAKKAKNVRFAPDTGIIVSDQDKAQLGQAFAAIQGQLIGTGWPLKEAVTMAQKFVPSAEIDNNIMNALTEGESEGMDEDLWKKLNGNNGNDGGFENEQL